MKPDTLTNHDLNGRFTKNNNAARIPVEIDWKQAGFLCQIHCTKEEVGAFFGLSVRTLERRCESDLGIPFADFYTQKREVGRISLRRSQYLSAMGEKGKTVTRTIHRDGTVLETEKEEYILPPSIPMQIWLGKNQLGQKNEVSIDELQVQRRIFKICIGDKYKNGDKDDESK